MERLIQKNIDQLEELKSCVQFLEESEYSNKTDLLSGSCIGQHVRHIIEFYQVLQGSLESGKINYDLRQRNLKIESQVDNAIFSIDVCQLPTQSKIYCSVLKLAFAFFDSG